MADSSERTASKREYYPLRTADVLAIAVFWALLGFISTVSRELDPRFPGIPPRILRAVELATYLEYALWAALALPIWWLASRYSVEGGRRLGRILLFVILGIVVAIAVDTLLVRVREAILFGSIDGRPGGPRRRPVPTLLGLGFLDDLMVYFAVLGAGVARDYFLRYRTRLQETARLQQQLAQARLDALRTQLNPHFLFNTLNAVSALVDRDPRGARRMIARLSDLLRYTLDESTGQEVPLRRELDLLGEYVELMQIRFQGKLAVETLIDDDARDAMVPNLILQPLVENAVKHGVGRLTGGGRISIRARRGRVGETDALIVTVADNGPGPGGGEEGVGLRNTNARLREMYGDEYRVVLRPAAQPGATSGTEAEIAVPYHTATQVARAS